MTARKQCAHWLQLKPETEFSFRGPDRTDRNSFCRPCGPNNFSNANRWHIKLDSYRLLAATIQAQWRDQLQGPHQ